MKTTSLLSSLALTALAGCLSSGLLALDLTEAVVRDQVEAELPAGVRVVSLSFKAHGQPVKKVKASVTVEATQNLYAMAEFRPTLQSAAAGLSDDLRKGTPLPLKVLKVVLPKGAVPDPLELEFKAAHTGGSLSLELLEGDVFLGLGKPLSRFPAGTPTEDSPEGRREIAAWKEAVNSFNTKVALTDKRARVDRNMDLFVTVVDKGLGAYKQVTSGQGSSGATPAPAPVSPAGAAPDSTATAPGMPQSNSLTNDKVGETVKRIGGFLGALGAR